MCKVFCGAVNVSHFRAWVEGGRLKGVDSS